MASRPIFGSTGDVGELVLAGGVSHGVEHVGNGVFAGILEALLGGNAAADGRAEAFDLLDDDSRFSAAQEPPLFDDSEDLGADVPEFVAGSVHLQEDLVAVRVGLGQFQKLQRIGRTVNDRLGVTGGQVQTADGGVMKEIIPIVFQALAETDADRTNRDRQECHHTLFHKHKRTPKTVLS